MENPSPNPITSFLQAARGRRPPDIGPSPARQWEMKNAVYVLYNMYILYIYIMYYMYYMILYVLYVLYVLYDIIYIYIYMCT